LPVEPVGATDDEDGAGLDAECEGDDEEGLPSLLPLHADNATEAAKAAAASA
jgi:hypothetical protein